MAEITLNQYAPGGVMNQLATDVDHGVVLNQYAPGGPVEQIRLLADPTLVLNQHAPGGPLEQIVQVLEGGGGEELAFADFTGTGTYRLAGSPAVVSDVVAEVDPDNWGPFNPATDITVEGLTGTPGIATGLRDTLLASGFTVVGTYTPSEEWGYIQIDAYDGPSFSEEWFFDAAFDNTVEKGHIASTVKAAATNVNGDPVEEESSVKFAATITATRVSLSILGGAVITDTTALEATYNNIGIYTEGCILTTLTFLPPKEDAELVSLSASG